MKVCRGDKGDGVSAEPASIQTVTATCGAFQDAHTRHTVGVFKDICPTPEPAKRLIFNARMSAPKLHPILRQTTYTTNGKPSRTRAKELGDVLLASPIFSPRFASGVFAQDRPSAFPP